MTTALAGLFWISFIAFGWTYIGYPLLMYIYSKVKPVPVHKDDRFLPSLTLLIPAYNEADVIGPKLENSLALSYPRDRLQILVIDDGSDDNTPNIVQQYGDRGVTLARQSVRTGKMAAVNRGFALATGEIVVLSDASPHYKANALLMLARAFADPMVGVVVGDLAVWDAQNAVAKPAGLYWKYEAALRRWESLTGSTVAVHGNMFAIRHALHRPLLANTINDEFSLAMEVMRQGYRVVYEPEAISFDHASRTMEDEFKRRVRINAGRYQALFSAGYLRAPTLGLTFRLFSHKLLRPLTPVLMLLMLLTNLLLVLLPINLSARSWGPFSLPVWFWAAALAGQLMLYTLAGLGLLAERQHLHSRFLNLPYYFVSVNVAALVGLLRWMGNTQRVTWQKRQGEH